MQGGEPSQAAAVARGGQAHVYKRSLTYGVNYYSQDFSLQHKN